MDAALTAAVTLLIGGCVAAGTVAGPATGFALTGALVGSTEFGAPMAVDGLIISCGPANGLLGASALPPNGVVLGLAFAAGTAGSTAQAK